MQPSRSPLCKLWGCLFTDHPHSIGERYGEHLLFVLGVAWYLVVTAFVLIIHGLFPCCFEFTGSDRIKALHDRLQARKPKAPLTCAE